MRDLLAALLDHVDDQPLEKRKGVDLEIERDDPYVWGKEEQLRDLFRTLLDQGRQFFKNLDQHSHCAISVSPATSQPTSHLFVKVMVWGAGTRPSPTSPVTHPLPLDQTTREHIHAILQEHHGSMSEDHDVPHHLEFHLVLPSYQPEPSDTFSSHLPPLALTDPSIAPDRPSNGEGSPASLTSPT